MNIVALRASRTAWRSLENRRYKKWYTYRHKPGTPGVHAERARWWVLYTEARAKRQRRDHEIKTAEKVHGPAQEVSLNGTKFVMKFEGYVGHVYRDSVGVPTVGYGHTENVPGNGIWIKNQRSRGHLTPTEALLLLHQDLNIHYAPVIKDLYLGLTQNAFDALVSFIYNVGAGGVGSGTHVGQYLRHHQFIAAANSLLEWDKASGQVLEGLRIRREAERNLFLKV